MPWNSWWDRNNDSSSSSHSGPTSADVPPYTSSSGGNYQQVNSDFAQQLLSFLVGSGAFHPGAFSPPAKPWQGVPNGAQNNPNGAHRNGSPSPSQNASAQPSQSRQSVPLSVLVNQANTPVAWRRTVKPADCIEAIRDKERVLDHDFSVENVKAERAQLKSLPQTIKRLTSELEDANDRFIELQTLEPHFNECDEIRARHYQATHSGKRQRLTPQERDEAKYKKQAEAEEDADFVAPEDPPAPKA